MNSKLIATLITLGLMLVITALFFINPEGHLVGSNENYDFLAGPVLVALYGLSSVYNFTAQAIIAFLVFWLCLLKTLEKSGLPRLLFALAAMLCWLASGVYTLAQAYG